jgi:hypothetical protein
VWTTGRNVVRAGGILTSPLRPLPDFVIIGAKRGGTTSLYRYLLRHPRVIPMFPSARRLPLAADPKGVHYFDTDFHRGLSWYRSHFPSVLTRAVISQRTGGRAISGEASPYYLCHHQAAERAARTIGSARLLLLLREPVERTYSHYREQVRNGVEPLDFEAALAAEPERLAEARRSGRRWADTFAYEHQGYVTQSEYAPALARWLALFPREQMLVLRSENLYAEPQRTYNRVLSYLDLPSHPLADVKSWNAAPGEDMHPATRVRLRAHFAPYNEQLAALVGGDLGWSD